MKHYRCLMIRCRVNRTEYSALDMESNADRFTALSQMTSLELTTLYIGSTASNHSSGMKFNGTLVIFLFFFLILPAIPLLDKVRYIEKAKHEIRITFLNMRCP